jgi:glycosyltransferase involved in cell wall biosynthesis
VLWNGGIWQWLDAPTAIRAIARVRARRPRAALVFMGGAGDHPAARAAAAQARALATDLGLLGTAVIFNDGWVPYGERARWLSQADCALSAAHDHLETRFAFRTRLLDCLWSGLPIACTAGDELASQVARQDLGAVAGAGDAEGLAEAIDCVLGRGRDAYAPQLHAAAASATWERAAQPLLRWVKEAARPGGSEAPSAARQALAPPPSQRLRTLAYTTVGRHLLGRRR